MLFYLSFGIILDVVLELIIKYISVLFLKNGKHNKIYR